MKAIVTKVCKKCQKEKPVDEFYQRARYKNGITSWCKQCHKDKDHVWQQENKQRVKELNHLSYERNKEHKNKKAVEWSKANPVKRKKSVETWRANNWERFKSKARAWWSSNPLKPLEYHANRRARALGNGGTFTDKDWNEILEKYGHKCLKCGSTDRIQPDHVIPLARGGRNDKSNIQPLCKRCNVRKHAKIEDYRPR
jgi:5-methylcytosine-specific restriction endonuclease McrA